MLLTRRSTLGVLVSGLFLVACGGASASVAQATPTAPAGFAAYGFPNVSATLKFKPGLAATMTSGQLAVQIPANAFTEPVTFQLLQGNQSYWQRYVPAGQTVVADFAFRVLDSSGALVANFNKPVLVVLTNPQVGATTVYENATATKPPQVVENPVPSQIQNHVLKHAVSAAGVGWVIANPAA
ncbi:MAG: hypothetical protein ACYDA0_01545 [Candidatus Dormibacteraceae bacterium]